MASSVILIRYGMSFGMIKSYLWLTGILTSRPTLDYRRVYSLYLFNPENPQKLHDVKKNRKVNRNLYRPTPLWRLVDRLDDVKYNIEVRNLSADLLVYMIFMLIVCYLVLYNRAATGYFSYDVTKNLVVHSYYTNSLPFTKIKTYNSLVVYLKESLLPALLINHTQREKLERDNMSPSDYESYGYSNNTTVFQRSWTMDPAIKLIGIPRLRQLRATTETCTESKYIKSRNKKCAQELTMFNQEKGNFTIRWALFPKKDLNDLKVSPWYYQTGLETYTLPIFSQFSYYSSGGYVLNLAKNFNDSQLIIDYMHNLQWIDIQTRVIFIEFTTYCVNTNIFVVVTLIVEKSATGYLIPSYQIDPCVFLFTDRNFEIIYLFIVVSIFLRSHYVNNLVEILDKSSNNVFVSFIYAAACNYFLAMSSIIGRSVALDDTFDFQLFFLCPCKIYTGHRTSFFVKQKTINFSKYYLFTILTETAIKNLFFALYYQNEEEKKILREKALTALFLNVVRIPKHCLIGKDTEYFLIGNNNLFK
ncbi:pkd1l2, putative [Pediculus humanus corporis]|uniref:Pkd1l2, putative n=1 Tax=Pediculus humanus subsp. corporis TaxID=121224 RepID=E0VJI1_PEDHC|nr:pkd1l2, putative [Pediculus humanus corporis]EEB13537.1 pkd1l2, putative [Pediculus humanus corporis]